MHPGSLATHLSLPHDLAISSKTKYLKCASDSPESAFCCVYKKRVNKKRKKRNLYIAVCVN